MNKILQSVEFLMSETPKKSRSLIQTAQNLRKEARFRARMSFVSIREARESDGIRLSRAMCGAAPVTDGAWELRADAGGVWGSLMSIWAACEGGVRACAVRENGPGCEMALDARKAPRGAPSYKAKRSKRSYLPCHCGARFSTKAAGPSMPSAVFSRKRYAASL